MRHWRRASSYLYFQPQVNLQTRRLTGMEALIRWHHPTRGMVPPGMFISIAEECGLIHGISRWVLEQACPQNAAWQAAGLPRRRMAVNISSANFKRGDLCQVIADVLARTQLPPQYLRLTPSANFRPTGHIKGIYRSLTGLGKYAAT